MKIILVAIMILVSTVSAYAKEQWIITSLEWEPYAGVALPEQGTSIKILRDALKKVDVELIVEFLPWTRAKLTAKDESHVGYFPSWQDEVDEGFIASPQIDNSELSVIKRAGKEVKYTNMEELFRNYNVGVVSNYVYPKDVMNVMKIHPTHVERAISDEILMRKLVADRQPVVLTSAKVITHLAKKEKKQDFIEVVAEIQQMPLVMAFRNDKDAQRKIEMLTKALNSK